MKNFDKYSVLYDNEFLKIMAKAKERSEEEDQLFMPYYPPADFVLTLIEKDDQYDFLKDWFSKVPEVHHKLMGNGIIDILTDLQIQDEDILNTKGKIDERIFHYLESMGIDDLWERLSSGYVHMDKEFALTYEEFLDLSIVNDVFDISI
ncbi:hypothetical protein Bp8pS_085 [Bacillus phage vB_BpuM-BpSp]|nr:hypothetical protein Bp8pS_085 [Bacillus phage vB_BpuM-BpSp]